MAINVYNGYADLMRHVGHDIEIVYYGGKAANVAIECITCNEVLLDFNNPELEEGEQNA
jgi:hypothetical protein